MLSRRTFMSITAMMLVVCFLFLLPQVVKEKRNPYTVNSFADAQPELTRAQQWSQPALNDAAVFHKVDTYGVYIGSADSSLGYTVKTWASFTKLPLAVFDTVAQAAAFMTREPELVLIDPDYCAFSGDTAQLEQWNEAGITMIFCKLPSVEELQSNTALRELLGIRRIGGEHVALSAIRLFEGFLLGGEQLYQVSAEWGLEGIDLDLEATWVIPTNGTKVYLQGELPLETLPEQDFRNEQLPALLWRRARNGANIFVVNGDYLSHNLGIGFLSAMMAENRPYYLYPVVNAQVLTVANFPSMAEENKAALYQRYGKGAGALVRDLLWPSMESMSEINGFRMSCFEMPQYCYDDDKEPEKAMISYYLRLMRERNAEAGVSLQHGQEITLTEKWNRDQAFLAQDARDYLYNAAFLTEAELGEWNSSLPFAAVSAKLEQKDGLLFFLDEDTLCQTVTNDLLNYSCRSDLELRSIQTALAYTNPMLDMHTILWPEEGAYGWEVAYEKSASNLHTYWKQFDYFDRMTVSESDRRIRSFLAMDYSQHREDDTVFLELTGTDTADFLLHTHMELVAGVEGGSAQELETGIWLIHAQQPQVKITMKTDEQFEY